MIKVIETREFADGMGALRDRNTRQRIVVRIARLANGNAGDVKPVGEGVSELRISYGPGYRVYFIQQGQELVILLVGGDKSTQAADIARARSEARLWKE